MIAMSFKIFNIAYGILLLLVWIVNNKWWLKNVRISYRKTLVHATFIGFYTISTKSEGKVWQCFCVLTSAVFFSLQMLRNREDIFLHFRFNWTRELLARFSFKPIGQALYLIYLFNATPWSGHVQLVWPIFLKQRDGKTVWKRPSP